MRSRGVKEDSTIKAIGSLFRRLESSDWHINVELSPNQVKKQFSVSRIPELARRRIINPTGECARSGYTQSIPITSTKNWKVKQILECPIAAVKRNKDSDQWCFEFENEGIRFFLPQLEMARALFFHQACIARLALIPQGLDQDFAICRTDQSSETIVKIMPTSPLPVFVRKDYRLRRILAWILLDTSARRSFESITRYQLKDGYHEKGTRRWCFRFDPPLLADTVLQLSGHYDKSAGAFFVYEVNGIKQLSHNCPSKVSFYDPRYFIEELHPGEGQTGSPGQPGPPQNPPPPLENEIEDEDNPEPRPTEVSIETPKVSFDFLKPMYTTRNGRTTKPGFREPSDEEDKEEEEEDLGSPGLSPGEPTTDGTLQPAEYLGAEDHSDDVHLYAGKFAAFQRMVTYLTEKYQCKCLKEEIKKLPKAVGFSKYLLKDGNPRCIGYYHIKFNSIDYILAEIDTSDNKVRLSTLLIRDWSMNSNFEEIQIRLTKNIPKSSLAWPTSWLDYTYKNKYARISHPRRRATKDSTFDEESIEHWARRTYDTMKGLRTKA